jgi:cobalt/nickel transport system permease protein
LKHSFIDKYSHLNSPVHRLDPRIKLITAFSCILIIVSEPRGEIFSFGFYALVVLGLIILSRVPVRFILSRCLIVSPFILIAAFFYPVSTMLTFNYKSVSALQPEVMVALSIVFKAYLSVILLTMLVSTDKFQNLLLGLRNLKMPRILGIMSALMYRYIFILYDEALRTTRARDSRTPGKIKINKLKVYGNQSAMIFLRSWERSQTIYNSMLSRGFNGEFPGMHKLTFTRSDLLYPVLFVILILSIRLTNQKEVCYYLFN